jgi:hypothetical protein
MTWPRLGVLALALALCTAAACVIGPKPDDPATPAINGPDADKQGDAGGFDYADAATGDTGPLAPAADTDTLSGGGACEAALADGADAGCPTVDATSDAAGDAGDASDASGETPLDGASVVEGGAGG